MSVAKWRISKMSDMQFWKSHDFREILYLEAFGVAEYGFDIGFLEFKMADSIWRTQYFGNPRIFVELCTLGLLGSLSTNLTSDFHFQEWRIQYGGYEILENRRIRHIGSGGWGLKFRTTKRKTTNISEFKNLKILSTHFFSIF